MVQQGSPELLHDPVAEKLLGSTIPARLAYTWMDGTPRVVPVWFHWTGEQFVIGSPARAPKLKALAANPHVALTIDDHEWPYSVLMVRGTAEVEMLDDVVPEYALRPSGTSARSRARRGCRHFAASPWRAFPLRRCGPGSWTTRPGSQARSRYSPRPASPAWTPSAGLPLTITSWPSRTPRGER